MLHILVVDDEAGIASLFQSYLESAGYRVTVAHDGESALAADACDPADALVTDAIMPHMNGQELVARLRDRRPGLPAIIVTGYAGGGEAGAPQTVLLDKPVRLEALAQRLAELLAEAEKTRKGSA